MYVETGMLICMIKMHVKNMLPETFYDKTSELRKHTLYKTLLSFFCYKIPAWDFTVMTPE